MKQYENYPTESKCGATRRSAWPPTRSLTLRSVILGILIFALALAPSAAFALGGTGAADDPYQISDANDLIKFRNIVNGTGGEEKDTGAHAKLMGDILDLSGVEENWTPIGKDEGTAYTGAFDGCGYKITGLKINRPEENNIGLFGVVTGGTVTNVHLVDVNISGYDYVGGVVGRSTEGSTVSNCTNSGDVTSERNFTGGIVGHNSGNGTVSNCTNSGNVSGMGSFSYYVGGIVGRSEGSTVSNCANSGNVSGAVNDVGGVVGHNSGNGIVSNCVNSGNVSSGFNHVGGIVGRSTEGSVSNCTNSGKVSSVNSRVGGICGFIESGGIVSNCTNFGEVIISGKGDYVGGVVGFNDGSTVSNCTNSGNVSGTYNYVGGVVGHNYVNATVSSCVNSGKVSGIDLVGGVIGSTYEGTVENCGYYKQEGSTQDTVGVGDVRGTYEIPADALDSIVAAISATIDKNTIRPGDNVTITLATSPNSPDGVFDPKNGAVRRVSASLSQSTEVSAAAAAKEGIVTVTIPSGGLTAGPAAITLTVPFHATDFGNIGSYVTEPTEYKFTFPVTISDSNIALEGIELSQKELTLNIDKTANISVTYTPDSATNKTVKWKSGDESIATVESTGEGTAIVTAVRAGTTRITATSDDGWHTAECEVTVTPIYVTGVTISPDITELYLDGSGYTFTASVSPENATYKGVTWSIEDVNGTLVKDGSVTLSNATDNPVTLKTSSASSAGSVKLTAATVGTAENGEKLSDELTLSFALPNVKGLALDEKTLEINMNYETSGELTAEVSPSNAVYSAVTWTIEPAIAEISYGGDKQTKAVITPTKGGKATITAAVGGYSDSCTLIVTPVYATGITLSQNELSLESGKSATLTATVTPDNATDKSVTWSSSNETVATVDENGTVTAHDAGTATITAKANGAKTALTLTGDCAVTVTMPPVPVENVAVTTKDGKAEQELAKGATLKLTVEITPSNATNPAVTWHSSNEAVATVSADGTVTAVGPGTATITATSADGSIQSNAIIITVPGSTDTPVTPETPTEPTAPQGSGGGGGGCSAGFGALALLAIAPLALKRRK